MAESKEMGKNIQHIDICTKNIRVKYLKDYSLTTYVE